MKLGEDNSIPESGRRLPGQKERGGDRQQGTRKKFFFVSTSGKTPKCGAPEVKFLTSRTDYRFVCTIVEVGINQPC